MKKMKKKMSDYNYTPIKTDKLNKKAKLKLNKIDEFVKLGVKRMCLSRPEFTELHNTMSKECQEFHKYEIPYKGSIIYSVDWKASDGLPIPDNSIVTMMNLEEKE